MSFSSERKPDSLAKRSNPGLGKEEYKLSLKFLVVPESNGVLKNDVDLSKGHGVNMKEPLLAPSGTV